MAASRLWVGNLVASGYGAACGSVDLIQEFQYRISQGVRERFSILIP